VIGAVELVEVLDTETGKKFEAAIPLCSIRKGKLAYPEPESYPSICGSAISNQ
jgi:hypothetical protein